jgi:hypothetical protein
MRFKDTRFYLGQDSAPEPEGKRYAVADTRTAWMCWKDGKPDLGRSIELPEGPVYRRAIDRAHKALGTDGRL